jgi:hypothetical protein
VTAWDVTDLDRIGSATELELATRAPDGAMSVFTTMWVVAVEGAAYVRSARGPVGAWYRRALGYGAGRIRAGGVERDVSFEPVPAHDMKVHLALDAAYHAKYDSYGPRIVGTVVGPDAAAVTLRLDPSVEETP